MKFVYNIALLGFTLLLTTGQATAQAADQALAEVVSSLISGDSGKLSQHFGQRVEITMNGSAKWYDRSQALYVMRRFFADFPPGSFSINHRGKSGGTLYALGSYRSPRGSFNVDIYIKLAGGSISAIRMDAAP